MIFILHQTYSEPRERLVLQWRVGDPYAKPAYATRCNTTNLVLKVRRRRRKSATGEEEVQYCTEVLGVIGTTYKYQGLNNGS
jgi:hypothetical protein